MKKDALVIAVERARHGDAKAFDGLVRQFQNTAVAYARTIVFDASAAEDAAQEAFVQAWIDLPALRDAAAFAPWLRRIIFKFCDREKRSSRPAIALAGDLLSSDGDPQAAAELAFEAAQIRDAIDALPCTLREITLLYYMTGRDVKEIADFMELSPSTVKNRLHAARKRLRKELWTMAETILEQEQPSRNDTFAGDILARVLREFQHQEADDIRTADRKLLDEGRKALFDLLAAGEPINAATVRDGFMLLWRKWDHKAISTLLMHYMAQPLSDSEAAWARMFLHTSICAIGSDIGALLATEDFLRWLPGKSPTLSYDWPFYPVVEGSDEPVLDRDGLTLMCLGGTLQYTGTILGSVRRQYLDKFDEAISAIPITRNNCRVRLWELGMAVQSCILYRKADRDFDRAEGYIQQMRNLSAAAGDERTRSEFLGKALSYEVMLNMKKDDDGGFDAAVAALSELLDSSKRPDDTTPEWVRDERYMLAWRLMEGHRYDRALPLWQTITAATTTAEKDFGGWDWMGYAAAIWKLTADREQTLALLREAALHSDGGITHDFEKQPDFVDVRDDPEFLRAVARN